MLVFALSTLGVLAPAAAQAQTVTAMWDPNPSADQITTYQVCIGTSSGSCNRHSTSVSAGQTSFTFTPTPQVLHYVAVRATNARGAGGYSAEKTFSIPAFTQPANQSSTVGVAIAPLDLVVTDADGSPRQFTHTGLPVGLTLNAATGRITGTPAAAGTHNVTVFVNDSLVTVSRSFTWTVTAAPPVDQTGPALTITSHTSGQNVAATSITLAGTASDSGRGNTGIAGVTVNGQPATGGSASGTGTATWSLTINLSTGANALSVQARDGAGNVTTQQITIQGTAPPVDQTGPVLTITSHTSGQNVAATSVTLRGTASDSGRGNSGIASVTVNGQPATGGTASGTGTANWSHTISLSIGSNVIAVQARDGAGNVTTQQITINGTAPVCQSHDDSNGDCRADLVWRNSVTGQNVLWYLNGTTLLGDAWLPTVAETTWQLAASADINRDGARDLIWRNSVSGQNVVWYMNGATLLGDARLPTVAETTWQLAASADINRDGARDLIWRNSVSGQNVVWYMNGATLLGEAWLPTVAEITWQLAASADVNQDGSADLIWRNSVSGKNVIWYMNGATLMGDSWLSTIAAEWSLTAALDTDSDGATELIWRHTSTGENRVWYLNQTTVIGEAALPTVADPTWTLLGTK